MLTILEYAVLFVFFYLFQSMIFVYSIHLFSNHPVRWKLYFICAFLSMVATYLARQLTYGVHTLYSLIALILLAVVLLRIPAQKVVKSALLIALLTLVFELVISLICIAIVGKDNYTEFLETNRGKSVIGILINLMLALSLVPVYFYKKNKARREGENNGKTG